MKTCPFCLILILATPALAAINQVQSKANWSGGATSCAVQFNFGTTTNNLVVVWTLWTSTSALASVSDNTALDVFASAVGPTLQSASNTSAQIFYAKNIHGTTNPITVSFSGGSATSTGCVAVEYSGADLNYPLDSASAGYSTALNPTGLLDSGTVAPANANLLLFGGGTTDYIARLAGSRERVHGDSVDFRQHHGADDRVG